jgi:hypothetical protein
LSVNISCFPNYERSPKFGDLLNYKKYIYITVLISHSVLISFCAQENTIEIEPEKFANILSEVLMIEKLNCDNTAKKQMLDSVLTSHSINGDSFKAHLNLKKQDGKYWSKVYAKAAHLIQTKIKANNVRKKETLQFKLQETDSGR